MTRQRFLPLLFACALGFFAPAASSSTFYLTESNTWADGISYAQVDVMENGGNLDFTVTALAPEGYQLSNFYFNLKSDTGAINLIGLPDGWTAAKKAQNISEFGLFSNGEKGDGSTLQSSFSFTADSLFDLTLSSLVANDEGWIFAAHMQCQNTPDNECFGFLNANGELDADGKLFTSHQIAGPGVSVVPLPAAAWLFGSALLGFVSFTSRRKA